jgi:hypothetical protein
MWGRGRKRGNVSSTEAIQESTVGHVKKSSGDARFAVFAVLPIK